MYEKGGNPSNACCFKTKSSFYPNKGYVTFVLNKIASMVEIKLF